MYWVEHSQPKLLHTNYGQTHFKSIRTVRLAYVRTHKWIDNGRADNSGISKPVPSIESVDFEPSRPECACAYNPEYYTIVSCGETWSCFRQSLTSSIDLYDSDDISSICHSSGSITQQTTRCTINHTIDSPRLAETKITYSRIISVQFYLNKCLRFARNVLAEMWHGEQHVTSHTPHAIMSAR